MFVVVVTAPNVDQHPTILFEPGYDFTTVHACYYTHYTHNVNVALLGHLFLEHAAHRTKGAAAF